MEKFVERTLLYDFYGELLTAHQREIYEDVVLNDYSISEVAAELGISRQGVHDQIRRVDKLLDGYEDKLRLVQKFIRIRDQVDQIRKTVEACDPAGLDEAKRLVAKLSDSILEEL